jgi:hypothetical protein
MVVWLIVLFHLSYVSIDCGIGNFILPQQVTSILCDGLSNTCHSFMQQTYCYTLMTMGQLVA